MPSTHSRRAAAALLGFGGCALASLLLVVRAAPPQVLFVTGSTTLGPGDTAVKARLEATDHVVEVRAASAPNLGNVTGKDLVIISSSAPAATVGATFKDTTIGVITWQSAIFDDMRLTGTVSGTDFGTSPHFTEVVISAAPTAPSPAEPKDPGSLTAYLPRVPGIITVTSDDVPYSWGKPGSTAFAIATLGDTPKAAIFAYDQGKTLVGSPTLQAPARRVGLFLNDAVVPVLIEDGWKLFDAAVEWVVFKNAAPVIDAKADLILDPRVSRNIVVNATATDDHLPYPTALGVTWTKISGPGAVTFAPATQPNTVVTIPLPTAPNAIDVYELRLTATDGLVTVNDSKLLTISNNCVSPPTPPLCQNNAPIVELADFYPTATFGVPLSLAGTVTDEGLPLGGPLTYAWSKVSGPGTATFMPNATVLTPTVTFSAPGLYVLQLCATDGPAGNGGLTGCKTTNNPETPIVVKPHALLVTGTTPQSGDDKLKDRLEDLGYTVTVKSTVIPGDAGGKNIVVIAGTAVDANVTNKFKPATQGVLVLKHSLLDDMSMASAASVGTTAGQTHITIIDPADRLAAGFSATDPLPVSGPATYTWGSGLPAAAKKVATLAGDGTKFTIFRYETGAMMVAPFTAAGPRAAFFAQDVAASTLTDEKGWLLFDAAVGRVANLNLAPRANAGPNRGEVLQPGGNGIILAGTCIDDGMPAACTTFIWRDVPAGTCPATNLGLTSNNLSLHFGGAAHCRFRLTVTDGSLSGSDEVDVYVSDPNEPPEIISVTGPSSIDMTSTSGVFTGSAVFTANVTDDGLPSNPGFVSMTWSKVSGPGLVTFNPPGSLAPTATFSEKGAYVLMATASDGPPASGGLSSSRTVAVGVTKPALLVVGTYPIPSGSGDSILEGRMTDLGFTVQPLGAAGITAAAANGKAVVVISPSAGAVPGAAFNAVTVPVITMSEALFQTNRLTTAANRGFLTGQTDITVATIPLTNLEFGLTAGMVGQATVSKIGSFAWGIPGTQAKKIASLASDATKWTIFAYDKDATMVTGTAPARRVGFFARTDTVTQLIGKGLSLFDAAVNWAASDNMAPRVTLPSHATVSSVASPSLNLSGTATDDRRPPAVTNLAYAWSQVSGPEGGTAGFSQPTLLGPAGMPVSTSVTFTPVPPNTPAVTYVLRLSASDTELTGYADITVSVSAGNQAPVVNAGPDLTDDAGGLGSITLPNSGLLVGMAVDDGQPSPLVVSWSKVAGPGTAKFTTPSAPITSVSFDAKGRYVLRLTATDGAESSSDDVLVDVKADAVLISVAATLEPDEAAIKARLESLGFSVETVAAASASYSSADNKSLVFISPSTNLVDTDVGTKLRTVSTPVITTRASLLDEMALIASGTQQGTVSLDKISILSTQHPLAAGNPGPALVQVLSSPAPMGWGNVSTSAAKVAIQIGQTTHAILFGYEKGVAVPGGGNAAARRVGFLFCNPSLLGPNGWPHFDAAVRWATSINSPPRVVVTTADQTLTPSVFPHQMTVSGTVFDDGQPNPTLAWKAWSVAAGPAVNFGPPDALSTQVTFTQPGTYILRLAASDGALVGSDTVTLTLRLNQPPPAPNERPYVNAGTDQTIRFPNTAQLSGWVSDDGLPLPTALSKVWSKVLGPGTVIFGSASAVQTTATFPSAGHYVLRLSANDSGAAALCANEPIPAGCTRDDVTVIVLPSQTALLVVPNSAALTAGETAIKNRLIALAFGVTVADEEAGNLKSVGETKDLVFVSHADPAVLGSKLTLAEVPVIVSKATLYPNMLMADSEIPGAEFGETLNQTQIVVTNPNLALAAGLSGTITFTTAPTTFGFAGKLLTDWKAAEIPPEILDQGTLFGYEEGTTMLAALHAPGRRIGFPNAEGSLFTADAWKLFDAAVRWAVEPVVPALYVGGSCGSGYDEKETRRHMAVEGYAVTRIADNLVNASHAIGKAVVVVSRSVCAATLGNKLLGALVPVITFDPENFGVMQMTGTVAGDDYGTTPDQTKVSILDPSHPLAGRQKGLVGVLSASNGDFGWALPTSAASRAAVTVGFSYGATVFGYEKDAQMVDMLAPSRRIGLYMNENSVQQFTAAGWAIFDAALRWAGAEDSDRDGLSTFDEFKAGTSPTNPDTNGDGVLDGAQVFTDRGATNTDMDGDGLSNAIEIQNGTDPFNADTDGDRFLDAIDCFPLDATRKVCPFAPGDTTPPTIILTEPTPPTAVEVP